MYSIEETYTYPIFYTHTHVTDFILELEVHLVCLCTEIPH
jgi:hypothetical protein